MRRIGSNTQIGRVIAELWQQHRRGNYRASFKLMMGSLASSLPVVVLIGTIGKAFSVNLWHLMVLYAFLTVLVGIAIGGHLAAINIARCWRQSSKLRP